MTTKSTKITGDLGAVTETRKTPAPERAMALAFTGTGALAPDVLDGMVQWLRTEHVAQEQAAATVDETGAALEALEVQRKSLAADRTAALAQVQRTSAILARMSFALTTKEVRGAASLSQSALAKAVGVSQPQVSYWVKAGRAMTAVLGAPRAVGTSSEIAAYLTLDKVRRVQGADAVAQVVAQVAANVAAKGGKRATEADLSDAAATVAAVTAEPETNVSGAKVINALTKALDLLALTVDCSNAAQADEVRRLIAKVGAATPRLIRPTE